MRNDKLIGLSADRFCLWMMARCEQQMFDKKNREKKLKKKNWKNKNSEADITCIQDCDSISNISPKINWKRKLYETKIETRLLVRIRDMIHSPCYLTTFTNGVWFVDATRIRVCRRTNSLWKRKRYKRILLELYLYLSFLSLSLSLLKTVRTFKPRLSDPGPERPDWAWTSRIIIVIQRMYFLSVSAATSEIAKSSQNPPR